MRAAQRKRAGRRWESMRMIPILTAMLLAASIGGAAAQDFLKPLQDALEQVLPQEEPRRAPAPVEPERPVPPAQTEAEEIPPLPMPRPEGLGEPEVAVEPIAPEVEAGPPVTPEEEVAPPVTPEPPAEPLEARIYQGACPAVLLGLVEAEMLPPLSEGACGEQSPLSVTAVLSHGKMVPLSSPLITNCAMASALPAWVSAVEGYALATQNAGIERLNTGTSYMCRNRNNADEGLTSEHGFANAADIVGFTLNDGQTITVETDWPKASAPEGKFLRYAHDAACSGFTTVLGPEANELHRDHFHLDLGCHGRTCTARLCE